eukprot:scaffold140758_cov19-Prasinocladus_malaysianus.AAC.1
MESLHSRVHIRASGPQPSASQLTIGVGIAALSPGCASELERWRRSVSLADCCLDSMNLHAGPITDDPDNAGKLGDYSRVIGSAKQVKGCSFIPQVEVFDGIRAEHATHPTR